MQKQFSENFSITKWAPRALRTSQCRVGRPLPSYGTFCRSWTGERGEQSVLDVPSQHWSSRQELIDFLFGSQGGTRWRGRPTCPTSQSCLPASSEAGECGQTGRGIGRAPARPRLSIAFYKATCAALADAQGVGGSAGYCLTWPGPAWRPGWSLLSVFGARGAATRYVPSALLANKVGPGGGGQPLAAGHGRRQPRVLAGSGQIARHLPARQRGTKHPSLTPAAPIGAAPAPPLGTESKSPPPQPRGRVGGRPPPLRCRSPAASLPSTGVTPRTPCCDRGSPTKHTLSRTGAACARSRPQSRVGDLAQGAADQPALEDDCVWLGRSRTPVPGPRAVARSRSRLPPTVGGALLLL